MEVFDYKGKKEGKPSSPLKKFWKSNWLLAVYWVVLIFRLVLKRINETAGNVALVLLLVIGIILFVQLYYKMKTIKKTLER